MTDEIGGSLGALVVLANATTLYRRPAEIDWLGFEWKDGETHLCGNAGFPSHIHGHCCVCAVLGVDHAQEAGV